MERVRVRIYDNRLDKLINDPDGAVGRYLSNKGDQIKSIARSRVGVRTGRLKATIHKRHLRDPRGQYMLIGNDAPYAFYHHAGTRPRAIRPTHKGTKPNKYLLDALEQAL